MVKKNKPTKKETVGTGVGTAGNKPLEEALELSEERYRAILEQMYDHYYEVDLAGNFTFVNESTCRSVGYSQEELLGKSYRITVPEDDIMRIFTATKDVFKSGEPNRCYSHRILCKNGSIIFAESFIGIRKNKQGEIIGFRTVSRDVTESKKAESAQEIQHALSVKLSQVSDLNQAMRLCLEAAIEISGMDSGGIYIVDPDTGAIDLTCSIGVSREFISVISHYAKSSANASLIMAGKPVYANYSQISLSISKEPKSEGLKAMAIVPVSSSNRVVACLNIGTHSVEDMPVSSRNAIETIASQIGGTIERMQARDLISRSEQKYRLLAENMNDIIWILDMNLRTTYVSPSVESALGFKPEERMQQDITQQLTPASLAVAMDTLSRELAYEQTGEIKPSRSIIIESEYYHRDGSTIWFETVVTGIRNDQGTLTGLQGISRNIRERKQAEAALKEREERFRRISAITSDIAYSCGTGEDGSFSIDWMMGAAERITGYSIEEIKAQGCWRFLVVEEDQSLFDKYVTGLAPDSYNSCNLRIRHKNGGIVWIDSFAECVRNSHIQGRLLLYGGLRDISERKQVERLLEIQRDLGIELSQADYLDQALPACLEAAIAVSGMDSGGIYLVNPDTGDLSLVCSSGLSREFTAGASRFPKSSANAQLVLTGKPIYSRYQRLGVPISEERRSEGLKAIALIPVSSGKQVIACLNISSHSAEDISMSSRNAAETIASQIGGSIDRLRAREALGKSEEKFRLLVENSHDIIYTLTADGVFTFVSPAWTTLLGHPVNQVAGQPFKQFVHPDDVPACMVWLQKVIETGQRQDGIEYRVRHIDGSWYWHTSSAVPLSDKTGTVVGFEGTARDISEHKRLEEERQRVAKLESVGLLAGGIAHDFNNILTSILGNISLARMDAAPGSEIQESLEQAEKASLRAKDLTKQLLTFSKGGAPVKKLGSLTELLKDTAGFALRGSNVKCHFSIPADLWHAEIDAGQVSQVIHNLVINAKQAMPTGGTIELTAENIVLSKTQRLGKGLPVNEGSYVRIAITDHGTGIPKDHIEKIFDPFFTTKQEGSGLGLATSFSIARQHSGHISVESELGAGSTFYLYLPASAEMAITKHDKKETIKPDVKARILVMDDEKGVMEVAGRMLRHIGYKDIEFAADGAEAIKLYKAAIKCGNPFNVTILDLTIAGGMGGEETIKKLLKIDPGIKAIVSSGYADDPVIARYSDYGFSGIVAKPYTIEELGKAVHEAIG